MGKGVLGNDPFLRGAAVRPIPPREPAVPPPPQALAHAESPSLVGVVGEGALAHPNSPQLLSELTGTVLPHPASPELVAVLGDSAIAHPASPKLVAAVSEQPLEPAAAPTLRLASAPESRFEASPGSFLETVKGVARSLLTTMGAEAGLQLDALGRDEQLVRQLAPAADFLLDRYWRVKVEGAQNVPAGRAILVANHAGALPFDGPVLHRALCRERPELSSARWLVEDQIFYSPFLGVLLNRLGAVRANPDNAAGLLENERAVIVFPEGAQGLGKRFGERYQLKRFGRGGYVKLALRLGAPIIPVALVGSEETMPLLAKLPGSWLGLPYLPITPLPVPLPARWSIRFGEPIDLESLGAESAEDQAAVQRLNERTRSAIRSMLDELLAARGSVF